MQPPIKVVLGLTPAAMWVGTYCLLFTVTDWAWTHPGYVVMLTAPTISLINCRQIICNVT